MIAADLIATSMMCVLIIINLDPRSTQRVTRINHTHCRFLVPDNTYSVHSMFSFQIKKSS